MRLTNITERFLIILAVLVLLLGLLSSTWKSEAVGIKATRKMYHLKPFVNQNGSSPGKKSPCAINCAKISNSGKRKIVFAPTWIDPSKSGTSTPVKSSSKILIPFNETAPLPGVEHFKELTNIFREKRKNCRIQKLARTTVLTFPCEKVKWMSWFMNQLHRNSTDLLSPFVKLISSANIRSESLTETELMPENWAEKFVFRIIEKFGEPADKLFFHKFKEFTKSRDLQVKIPQLFEVQVSPRTHLETERTFFDPGFNLKLKLPFFHDELKFAVSTGPSFLAGIGVGIVVLGIKSIFSPFILAFKAYLLSWFFKDMTPFDFMKTILPGRWLPPDHEHHGWEGPPEMYEPSEVHHGYDYGIPDKKSALGTLTNMLSGSFFPSGDHYNPVVHSHSSPTHYSQSPPWDQGRTQAKPLINDDVPGPDGHESESDPSYVPSSALQEEVENFDPFYSPLLSRIDSIFMHLGFTEEGCKERAVCSIYKFPVKYAPYSNLLSAQLSKHQSELKRPVSTSPKILRYFKYMKAAKDGQASLNCIELYPKCTNDTEKLSNLPMVKTFQQLTELIGTGSG